MIPIDAEPGEPREIRLNWVGVVDHGWLAALTDVYTRHAGRPRHELEAALRLPLVVPTPYRARRIAEGVLGRLLRTHVPGPLVPATARAHLFAAARDRRPREVVLAEVATELGVTPTELEEALFADLWSERRVIVPERWPAPAELVTRVNQAWVRTTLLQSVSVRLEVLGETRRIVRVAHLRGLLCTVRSEGEPGAVDAVLELSGPYSLLRATTVYGRALAAIVPHLVHASRFVLRATAKNGVVTRIERGDPIFDDAGPPPMDSKLESAFAARFAKLTTEWDLVREPAPIAAGATLVFPDFALVHRRTGRRVLLEIVGFWTPEYLSQKLASLRRARIENLILCVSDELRCEPGELPATAIVVPFHRRVDPERVLAVIDTL